MIYKNEECCGCLKLGFLTGVMFYILGAEGQQEMPLCLDCRLNIDPLDNKYCVPVYYIKHKK
jgi:hypothetical protein